MKFTQKPIFIALVCSLFGMLLYVKTLNHKYVLDDYDAIVENAFVSQGLDGLSDIWTTEYRTGFSEEKGSIYRPLALSLFAVEWQLWPNDPGKAHGINILLYGIICGLLFYWLLLLFGQTHRWLPTIAALLFAAHPIHTEVVANIKSADELLALLFGLTALIAALKGMERHRIIWALVAVIGFFLALLSKEGAITLLPIFALSIWFFKPERTTYGIGITAILALPILVYFWLRSAALGGLSGAEEIPALDNILAAASGFEYYTSAIAICGLYVWKLVFPITLSHDYSLNEIELVGLNDGGFWLSFVVGVLLIAIALKYWKTQKILSFALLFFLLTFSLYSNLFLTIGTHFGERLLFLPSLGYVLALSWVLWKWGSKKTGTFEWKKSVLTTAAIIFLLFAYSAKTVARADEWKDELTLYSADVINAPKSCRTHYRLGRAYNKVALTLTNDASKKSYFSKAVASLKTSVKIYSKFSDAHSELGLAYQNFGQYELAISHNKKALEINPNHASTINNMGTVLFLQNDQNAAIPYFKRALEIKPNFRDAAGNLGSCYGTLQQYEEAILWFKKAVEIDPSYAPNYYFVALSYKNLGDEDAYNKWLAKAQKLDPRIGT